MKWVFLGLALLGLLVSVFSCTSEGQPNEAIDPAQRVVDQAIERHGSAQLERAVLAFDFRDYHYVAKRDGGTFRYERSFVDSAGRKVHDVMTNTDFTRRVDGEEMVVSDKKANAYRNSINSVIYFASLPLALNDPAVIKEYLGEAYIKGVPYHKIKVTFRQEGGGKDFEDEYVYWFHRDEYTMDYLAYNYRTDGGGARFRDAYQERTVQGVRFQDYYNLKPVSGTLDVVTFDSLFNNGAMEQVSVIKTENVSLDLE